jgi:hypothetical protein
MTENKHHVREAAKTRRTDIFRPLGWGRAKWLRMAARDQSGEFLNNKEMT